MDEPTFDMFRGTTDKDVVWLEAVSGLAKARERLEQIARVSLADTSCSPAQPIRSWPESTHDNPYNPWSRRPQEGPRSLEGAGTLLCSNGRSVRVTRPCR